jgi:saccharopine dehydrogenase-like NADP-dependent oxidoreductase
MDHSVAALVRPGCGTRTSSAIQITTAASICAVVDLYMSGQLPGTGFIRQEEINLQAFLDNRFGKWFRQSRD